MPYPPNFSRMAANTILPAIGASTCAFGSHKWVKNIGSFTKNPLIKRIEKIFDEYVIVLGIYIIVDRGFINKIINISSMGSEAIIVYIIMYILACTRSGWYPHTIIIIIVGTKDASNQI